MWIKKTSQLHHMIVVVLLVSIDGLKIKMTAKLLNVSTYQSQQH